MQDLDELLDPESRANEPYRGDVGLKLDAGPSRWFPIIGRVAEHLDRALRELASETVFLVSGVSPGSEFLKDLGH